MRDRLPFRGNLAKVLSLRAVCINVRQALIIACAGLAPFAGGELNAQTAGQIVQPSYAPPITRGSSGGLDLPESNELHVPAGADGLHVTPSGLIVDGSLPQLALDTEAIRSRLAGIRVSGTDLFIAARDLETAYVRAGFVLVRVSLPQQTLNDGEPLRLVVIDGYVAKIDATSLDPAVKTRVETLLAPLVGQRGLTRDELERRLLLAGDTPGMTLRSTLEKGSEPGATVLHVDGRFSPISYSFGTDNSMSEKLGRWASIVGMDANNMLGVGEVGYLRLASYSSLNDEGLFSSDPRNRQIVAGFNVPLGTDGFWLNGEYVESRTHPTSQFIYTMPDHFQRFSANLGYTWVRSRDVNTASTLGLDVADEHQDIFLLKTRIPFTKDRTRVLRFAQTGDMWLSTDGFISGRVALSQGLSAFGARSGTAEVPLSRYKASPDFRKINISFDFSQPLFSGNVGLSISAKGQSSFGSPLVSSEQMSLSGFDWISAYSSDAVIGDTGAAVRAELSFPKLVPTHQSSSLNFGVSPYMFAAAGVAHLEQATVLERSTTRASSVGLGARFHISQDDALNAATLMLEYSRGTATGSVAAERFNLRFSSRF